MFNLLARKTRPELSGRFKSFRFLRGGFSVVRSGVLSTPCRDVPGVRGVVS